MDIRPILSALRRHKTAAALIVLEIALSCAIICNAVFLISGRLERMDRPSGIAENEIVRIQLTGIGTSDNGEALTRTDLAALRSLPGVKAASSVNAMPYGNSSWNTSVMLTSEQTVPTLETTLYFADDQLTDTLGLNLIAGRGFKPDEFLEWSVITAPNSKAHASVGIITRSMAEKLFPGQSAVGKTFHAGDDPVRVVGVVDHLVRPNEQDGQTAHEYATVLPLRMPYDRSGNYLLRVSDPARRAEVLKAAVATLERINPRRIITDQKTLEEMRATYYQQDRSMAWLLIAVCVSLLVVTALGIVGLASFWVQQRTKQIGIRRALGATRGQVLRYFQTENFLLATLGIVIGMLMAYGINQLLMQHYELPRLPAIYLPVGAVALWLLGQLAVFGPARRAAAVPPAVATRSI
ncbi:ABC transporter permease [Montanilutibacter psychrotolerans]|uniref:FtsX-like permease family protein n=1 Tax=Montanilutibacter psychrotolerans TaxID=1327343 RepID=A0A3M8SLG7_9GAMM|nr:FtsX-like permease family protein [Lysobacter psychrotolerans]RNF82217.1 FtsX-like permease family protein [Lysobacter psychrotolerans]